MCARLHEVSPSRIGTDGAAPFAVLRRGALRAIRGCVATVEGVAFWIAALLPITALPLYAALQFVPPDSGLVVWIVATHLLALVVGHGHEPGRFGSDRSR